jgi:GABA(A) receptor-associated protein
MNTITSHYSSPTLRPTIPGSGATMTELTAQQQQQYPSDNIYSTSTFLSPIGGGVRVYNSEINKNSSVSGDISNDYLERVKKSQIILEKYPDRVPLIIQPSKNDRDSYPIDKSKYITPRDLTLLQLQQIIRKRVKFPAEKALFMFINNKIYPITSVVGTIYDTHKNADGFLYVTYCQESTFGNGSK